MRAEILEQATAVSGAEWNSLLGTDSPFLCHEFLVALESTGCVGAASGWVPCHVALRTDDGALAGAMPLYRKSNSFGEFIFDWAWADAYRRAGLRYFPKLVSAVPFTPATGHRFLTAPGMNREPLCRELLQTALGHARAVGASSLHVLFPTRTEAELLVQAGLLQRKDCQFHWENRGYADFEQFLGEFTAEKRKKAKRERRRVAEAGITFSHLAGAELTRERWQAIFPLYASSFWRRGREPYLNEAFFIRIATELPAQILAIVAELRGEPIAVAICFRSEDTLYGRYWGCAGEYHSLHFETCYYQGIEYCIEHGLKRFEPGTQGEHKISRGFVPTETLSCHWLSHPGFAAAIDDYLERERQYMDRYIEGALEHVPYRKPSS